jgi:hypothetical protein
VENLAIEALGTLRPEEPSIKSPDPRADQIPTPAKILTPIKLMSSPAENRPEPVYILAKPELVLMSGSPIVKPPGTPLKSLAAEIELEILNPPDSHSRPMQSLVRVASAKKAPAPPSVLVVRTASTEQVEELKQITPKGTASVFRVYKHELFSGVMDKSILKSCLCTRATSGSCA